MIKKSLILSLVIFPIILTMSCQPRGQRKGLWPEIKTETRPWTRWWWMGNAVDEKNIAELLRQYSSAGIGGVEITPIYGASGYEDKYLKFLSPEWMNVLSVTVKEAQKAGMGVDMNQGTGWPFGGPQITWPYAASKLIVQTYTIRAGKRFHEKMVIKDPRQQEAGALLQALIARNQLGTTVDLTDKVDADGKLNWKPEPGEWELYAAFCGKTLQRVKRAAPGGEGLVLDHFSREAVNVYLNRFDSAFHNSSQGVRCFFNDSYELSGTNWTPGMFDEFERLRGYRLQPWLNILAHPEDSSENARRIRYDYRQTISDLLLENFTMNWSQWAHQKKSLTRNQAHGSPGNLLDLYAAVDIPECETFGSSYFPIPGLRRDSADVRNVDPDPVMMKFASSAANVSGKPLTSCETFTWLAEHFKVSLSQCKPEVEQVFLSGVNHVFFHGTAYSPESAPWPGWLFYASVNFAPSNSFWPHLRGLTHYITRCQSVLQEGLPDNDLLVYWPISDYWMNSGNPDLQLTIHDIDQWLHPSEFYKIVTQCQSQGYSVDFVSDKLLDGLSVKNGRLYSPAGAEYKALVFPAVEFLPESTFKKATELKEEGALVIFGNIPPDVPGYGELTERRNELSDLISELKLEKKSGGDLSSRKGKGEIVVSSRIDKVLKSKGIFPEKLVESGLKFIRRASANGNYYFLVNHTPVKIDQYLPLNKIRKYCYLLDPLSDETGSADIKPDKRQAGIRIQLSSGESVIVYTTDQELRATPWKYEDHLSEPLTISGPWKLHYVQGGPVLPASVELAGLKPWTETGDTSAVNFSGTAVYSATFDLPGKNHTEYLLNLGKLYESARIRINGQDAGFIWSLPFTLRIGKFLKPGENTIEIEVANLMANRIRWMDRQKIEWRKYHEINFVNINYKTFSTRTWKPLVSGLEGPVTITAFQ